MLAQVWGLGLGVTAAHAAVNEPLTDTVRAAGAAGSAGPAGAGSGSGGALESVSGAVGAGGGTGTGGGSGHPAAGAGGTVDQLLQSRIRAGGLPLPGQATAVPDAFAIAAVLLPAVPAQPQPQAGGAPAGDRSARPAGSGGPQAVEAAAHPALPMAGGWTLTPGAGRAAGAVAEGPAGDGVSGLTLAARAAEPAASRDSGRGGVVLPWAGSAGSAGRAVLAQWTGEQPVRAAHATADGPLAATGSEGAVLFPIAAGLLLTGAAMYKHRGLPRGH